jgi:plastocyanin
MYLTALVSLLATLGANAAPLVGRQDPAPVTHFIEVGKDGLVYTPAFINASIGDEVTFRFWAKNHTLVQSTFADPCTPSGDIFAGFHPSNITNNQPNGTIYFDTASFQIGTDAPLWFYCAQADHCQKGMTFAINAPPAKVAEFNAVAANKTQNIAPSGGPVGVLLGTEAVVIVQEGVAD